MKEKGICGGIFICLILMVIYINGSFAKVLDEKSHLLTAINKSMKDDYKIKLHLVEGEYHELLEDMALELIGEINKCDHEVSYSLMLNNPLSDEFIDVMSVDENNSEYIVNFLRNEGQVMHIKKNKDQVDYQKSILAIINNQVINRSQTTINLQKNIVAYAIRCQKLSISLSINDLKESFPIVNDYTALYINQLTTIQLDFYIDIENYIRQIDITLTSQANSEKIRMTVTY